MKRTHLQPWFVACLGLTLALLATGCPSGGSEFTDDDGDGWAPLADCDDTNPGIHPLAEDIPYDGIDQDCSGEDLTDADRDGYDSTAVTGGTDCDDADPDVNPGAEEIPYDGVDRNCDDTPLNDVDGDGSDALVVGGADCCDDGTEEALGCSAATAASIRPSAAEIPYDGIDQNCDGNDYAGGASDADGDGFLTDHVPEGIDCDDADPLIHPLALERCNRIDDDCDWEVDEGLPDVDGDGHPACCDCDDFDWNIYPGAPEIPYDGVDQDCDRLDITDWDEDGFNSTVVAGGQDCNDFDPEIYPGATERCNFLDDNCDSQVDETFVGSGDADGDGWYALCECNDTNIAVYPGAPEVAGNLIDDNCNGLTDETDFDGDGYYGQVSGGDDCCDQGTEGAAGCNGANAWSMHPEALEIPYDGIDQDCLNGDLVDADGDGHIAVQVAGGDDCADWNAEAFPGHAEVCDDPDDNNCDGPANEGCGPGSDEDVRVDTGPFTMGRLAGDTEYPDQAPQHVVTLELYYIDKYEVTISQYRRCVNTGDCSNEPLDYQSLTDPLYWSNQQRGLHPAIHVSWTEASQYCAWAGKRLPSEAQWEKAARGPGTSTFAYPWGDVEYADPPDSARQRLPVDCDLSNHTHLCTGEMCEEDVVPVDSYADGASASYDAYNMAGNVTEWLNDYYDPGYYAISPASDPTGPAADLGWGRVVRGGSLFDLDYWIETTYRSSRQSWSRENGLGFRCARVPPHAP